MRMSRQGEPATRAWFAILQARLFIDSRGVCLHCKDNLVGALIRKSGSLCTVRHTRRYWIAGVDTTLVWIIKDFSFPCTMNSLHVQLEKPRSSVYSSSFGQILKRKKDSLKEHHDCTSLLPYSIHLIPLSFPQYITVLLQRALSELGLLPQVGRQEAVGVCDCREGGLECVLKSLGASRRGGVGVLYTSKL